MNKEKYKQKETHKIISQDLNTLMFEDFGFDFLYEQDDVYTVRYVGTNRAVELKDAKIENDTIEFIMTRETWNAITKTSYCETDYSSYRIPGSTYYKKKPWRNISKLDIVDYIDNKEMYNDSDDLGLI